MARERGGASGLLRLPVADAVELITTGLAAPQSCRVEDTG
jgi:hypothetical protein